MKVQLSCVYNLYQTKVNLSRKFGNLNSFYLKRNHESGRHMMTTATKNRPVMMIASRGSFGDSLASHSYRKIRQKSLYVPLYPVTFVRFVLNHKIHVCYSVLLILYDYKDSSGFYQGVWSPCKESLVLLLPGKVLSRHKIPALNTV